MSNTSDLNYIIPDRSKNNDIDYGKTDEIEREHLLIDSAAVGNFEKVQELLIAGISVEAEEFNKSLFYASKNYVLPLHIAAANGHKKCVQILIDHGADVNAKDHFGITALHMAAEQGHYLCIKLLVKAGADCSAATKFSKFSHYTAVPYHVGTTPLHLATANNHINCVKKLIQYGADFNAIDELGHSSLYIAAQAGFAACVLVHLKNAFTREILSIPSFDTSDTPLHFAVSYNMVDCVKELLYLGSDVHHCNNFGNSPLDLTLIPTINNRATKMEILKLIVLKGYNTDINCRDICGFKPLHYVCFDGFHGRLRRRPEMAEFLIAYGADVNIENTDGYSLLECELNSSDKNFEILRFLVKSMLHLPRLEALRVDTHRENLREGNLSVESSYIIKKQLWYEQIASNPRTLQHNCRYVIRSSMGASKLKYIRKLPIPPLLQSYLLLENDE